MKKRNRVTTCLIAGVLVLAVSATAAFGSVNGYARYKEAVKALALSEENLSALGVMEMTLDGETIWTMEGEAALDGPEQSTRYTMIQGDYATEEVSATVDGQHIWFYGDEDNYYTMPAETREGPYNLLGYDPGDEYNNRLVTFFEVACDTVVGELKNNFVQIGTEDGVDLYQVDIAQAQVPSLVNAGLSLFAYSMTESANDPWYTTYEDFDAARFHYYEAQTGETLPEDFKEAYAGDWTEEWYQANQELVDKVDAVCYGEDSCWSDAYDQILDENNGGIVYVHADGSYDYYPTLAEYVAANPEDSLDNFEVYIGEDLALENIHCTFGVDSDGRLTETKIVVTFITTGWDGQSHELVIAGEASFYDYGTTTVTLPDVGGRTEENVGEPTAESVEVEEW